MWILLCMVGVAVVNGHRDSCKVQCDRNFRPKTFGEVNELVPVCNRGCDMYVVAFISTSFNPKMEKQVVPLQNENLTTPKQSKLENGKEVYSINSIKRNPVSKTTAEPTLQPVQDHPVRAGEQTTTTKIPSDGKSIRKTNSIRIVKENSKKPSDEIDSNENPQIKLQMRAEHAKRTCRHACIIAYGEISQVEACVLGCHLQSTAENCKELSDHQKKTILPSMGKIESSMVNMVGHIGHFIRVSWSWAFPKTNTEEAIKIQEYGTQNANKQPHSLLISTINLKPKNSRDQIIRMNIKPDLIHILKNFRNDIHQPDLFENVFKLKESQDKMLNGKFHNSKSEQKSKSRKSELTKHEQNYNQNVILHYHQKFHEGMANHYQQIEDHKENEQPPWIKSPDIRQSLDILECISRKSGLPRWFIAVTMFSSIPVALWLCFSLTAPPDDTKISKAKTVDADSQQDCNDVAEEKVKLMSDYDDPIKPRFEIV